MNSQHKPEELASYSFEMPSAMLMYFLKLFPPSTQTPPHLLSASPDSCPSASWHCPCIDSASCRHRMVPKRPCATSVCLTSAGKGMLTVIPITGFGFKQGDPGQFRGRAASFTLPYRYLGYVQGHGWRGISLVHVGEELPSRGKRVSALPVWPLVPHKQPWPAHEQAQCSLMKPHSRPLLTCANTWPMQDRGPRENGK